MGRLLACISYLLIGTCVENWVCFAISTFFTVTRRLRQNKQNEFAAGADDCVQRIDTLYLIQSGLTPTATG
jgi:hypothetical protein